MGQYKQPENINEISHAVNSIHIASATLKRSGAIGTLEDVLNQNMPAPAQITSMPKINSITAYSKGQDDFAKGIDYNTKLPGFSPHQDDWRAGWVNAARSLCSIHNDLKDILERAPDIEHALRSSGKTRLANHVKKLFTPTSSEEGLCAAKAAGEMARVNAGPCLE